MRARSLLAAGVATVVGAAAVLAPLPAFADTTAGSYTGVVLEWTGSSELQAAPPNGSAANYFSAGPSDGSEGQYRASDGNVEIVQVAPDGSQAPATYATRGAHTPLVGQQRQLARWNDGHAEVAEDGSAVIEWTGTLSINFYDGLVPMWMVDQVLTVNADGTGTLVAHFDGYTSSIANPDEREEIDQVDDVVVARFSGVTVDTDNGFVVTPHYAGVTVEVPGGVAQNRTAPGWGAWPQEFIDFARVTGLESYFYTTGGVFDPRKPPYAFAVGFDGAIPEVPEEPEPEPEPTPSTPPPAVKPTTEGYLMWGTRASFRAYIAGPIGKGSITLSGGATGSGGSFRFFQTSSKWDSSKNTGTGNYGGAVRFTGHEGILDITMSNPIVTVTSPSSASLSFLVNGSRVTVGNVNLAAATKSKVTGGVAYSGAPVTLTAAGSNVFAWGSSTFYPAGTAMDPLTFVIGANGTGGSGGTVATFDKDEKWEPPAEPPSKVGVFGDPEALAALRPGGSVTLWADGFQPNEPDIKVVIYSEPMLLDAVTADASGRATWTGVLPSSLELGEHTITFQGTVNRGLVVNLQEYEEIGGCLALDANFSWGFKESFRAYIDGSIANGSWTVSDGAEYATPLFTWRNGVGAYDTDAGTGKIDFTGTVTFEGHEGLLTTVISNPSIQFESADRAILFLDVSGVKMEDALAGNDVEPTVMTGIPFVELDLAAGNVALSDDGSTLTGTGVPTAITAQGYQAFPNYEAGTAFDPIDFTITLATDCAVAPTPGETEGPAETPVDADGGIPSWVWIAVGIGALLLIALIVILVVAARRRAAR